MEEKNNCRGTNSKICVAEDNEEMLNYLIKEYGMNIKSLSKVLDMEPSFLDNFKKNKNSISIDKISSFTEKLITLYYMSKITPDERNRAILEVLIKNYNIGIDTIARMARVKKEDLENFMKDNHSISGEIKYKIATVSLFLHFMFKPSEV